MTDHNEAMRLAEPPNIDNLKKIAASDSTTAIRNALLAAIKWVQHLEQSLKFEQAASFRDQVAELTAERDQLRAEVERLMAAMTVPTIEPNSQNWQGMDGAIAFHLIERHADSWADAGRMMREWLEANALDHARTTHKDEG